MKQFSSIKMYSQMGKMLRLKLSISSFGMGKENESIALKMNKRKIIGKDVF